MWTKEVSICGNRAMSVKRNGNEFWALCSTKTFRLHTRCDRDSYLETKCCRNEFWLRSYTFLWLSCIKNKQKVFPQSSTDMWYGHCVPGFSRGSLLYSIRDRHVGIVDEYFMPWWTGIRPEKQLAVDRFILSHLFQCLDMSPCLKISMWSDLRICRCFLKRKTRKSRLREGQWLSYQNVLRHILF